MSRRKGSKNKTKEFADNVVEYTEVQQEENEIEETEKIIETVEETVSIYEASQQLMTSELAIKTWIDHGHLSSINGRIQMRSIRECKFNPRRFV